MKKSNLDQKVGYGRKDFDWLVERATTIGQFALGLEERIINIAKAMTQEVKQERQCWKDTHDVVMDLSSRIEVLEALASKKLEQAIEGPLPIKKKEGLC